MIITGIKKIGLLVSIRLQDNPVPSCEIFDDTLIPDSFWRIIPETREVDKPLITEYWKSTQQQVPGANVYKGQHIRIG